MSARADCLLPLASLAILACGGSPYPGFKEVAEGVHLRYHALGDGQRIPADGDSVLLRLRVAELGEAPGSYWSSERWYLTRDLRSGALAPVLRRLHTGDSMSVIAPAERWPWKALAKDAVASPPDTLLLQAEVALVDLRTPEMVREAEERMRQEDPEGFERRLISAYLAHHGGTWTRWGTSDLHYRIAGPVRDTARVQPGDSVTVRWRGHRLEDGRLFDDLGGRTGPFTWTYGTPDQVMKGVEVAVSLLRTGQEGEFIIPSAMAFGERGIPGLLDPHAPVRYIIRLESVVQTDSVS